ncbi:MAG: hypothetical protein ACYS21_03320 [Planctomycetota bacterium]|jgi:hypothetical protein
MKDIYKNPTLYYILVPVIVGLWPLLVWAVYLPKAEQAWEDDQKLYLEAQKTITEILELDDDRLDFRGADTATVEFDYTTDVDKVASLCKIPSANYELSSKPPRTSKGKKTQSCHVVLKEVNIASFARFLSTIQLRWADLECEKVTLKKKDGPPDAWKVDLDFKYYF